MKVYVAGKITGLDRSEAVAKFERAGKTLGDMGFSVLVPTVLPLIDGMSHADYMHVCLAMIDICDAAVFLPDWEDSPGAREEMDYAKRLGKKIYFWQDFCPCGKEEFMFEKEAGEYAKHFSDMTRYAYVEERTHVKQAFQKGAEFGYNKANEWHDLRKDPKDLPEQFNLILGYFNIVDGSPWNSNYVACQYGNGNWYDDCMTYIEQDREPIAWCELPKFEEE